ncbi:MAG: DNA polymerase III subunit gamma/tau [Phycisphaerae bacterium]|nr:DNA polymerase III subunit gamma/tau [Phycisphaerae bacterium]
MAYTVLARRYRSQRFDDVVGQDAISHTLKNAIKTGRIAHGYLFTGTRGVGKTTMARILAKSLNCLSVDGPTTEPCLKCDSCVAVNAGDDIDVIEIDGASNTGVDNIRDLRSNATYRPARGRYKIYIIDEVHMLSTGAFNALLKILEEPPGHIKFIFATTEPNKILPTIQSRCQRFDFANISPADIISQLKKILAEEKIKFEDDCIISLARLANGSMRDGLSLLDQLISAGAETLTVDMLEEVLGQPDREKIYSLLEKISSSDAASTLWYLDELLNSGMSCVGVLDSLIEAVRDLMVLKASAGANQSIVILTKSEKESLMKIAASFDIPALVYNVSLLEKLRWPVKNSDNPRALFEAALLRLALNEHFMNIPELLSGRGAVKSAAVQLKKNTPVISDSSETVLNTNPRINSGDRDRSITVAALKDVPVISVDFGIEQVKENWERIVESVRVGGNGRVADLLKKAQPIALRANVLSLGFSDEFSAKLCQSNGRAEAIENILSAVLGKKIKAVYEFVSAGSKAEAAPKPRGAKTSRKTMDDAANMPAIKTVLFGLDANIIEVNEESEEVKN